MTLFRTLVLIAACISCSNAVWARQKPVSLQDQQQAACVGDVQKFCKDAMPDVDKVTACMKTKKSVVSAKCAAMWDVK